jgi:rod shape-determining protein MreC
MNYLLRDKKKKTGTLVLKIVSVCIALSIIFFFFSASLTNLLHSAQHAVAYAFGYYNDPVRPIAENAYVKSLETENEQLKELLGRKPEKDERKLAVIITRPPKTPFDSFVIDSGEDNGIQVGDYVYGEFDFLIGQVESVSANTSIIKLFSSSDMKKDVLISSSTTPVVVEGRGNGNFYIKVPKNIDVYEGDPVVVPGFKNSLLGVVEKVDGGDGDAYSHIYFKLPVNINSLRYVQIKKISR